MIRSRDSEQWEIPPTSACNSPLVIFCPSPWCVPPDQTATGHCTVNDAFFHLECLLHGASSSHGMGNLGLPYACERQEMPVDTWTSDCSLVSRVKRSNTWKDFAMNWRFRKPARCLAASQRSATPTAETCPIQEQTTRRSLTENCPSCCLPHDRCDLSSVAFVVVMCYERKFPVSSPSCHNHYQFPSHADSDMSNTSWMGQRTRPFRHSGVPPPRE